MSSLWYVAKWDSPTVPEGKSRILDGLVYNADHFKKLNEEGYGIFATVNEVEGVSRKASNLSKLNACFGDLDIGKEGAISPERREEAKTALAAKLMFLECPPTEIVYTKNGLQPRWRLEQTIITKETLELFGQVEEGIIEWSVRNGCAGDTVKDLTRILRLPGFYHVKDPADPFLCTLEVIDAEKTFSLTELKQCFPIEPKGEIADSIKKSELKRSDNGAHIYNIPIEELVCKLKGWTYREPYFYDASGTGKHKACFKCSYANLLIHNGTDHLPLPKDGTDYYTPFTFVRDCYMIPERDVVSWFLEHYPKDDSPFTFEDAAQGVKEALQMIRRTDPQEFLSYGIPLMDHHLGGMFPGETILLGAISGTGKTTLVRRIAKSVCEANRKVLFIVLEGTPETQFMKLAHERLVTEEPVNYLDFRMNRNTAIHSRFPAVEEWADRSLQGMYFTRFAHFPDFYTVANAIRQAKERIGASLVIVDHLHCFTGDERDSKNDFLADAVNEIVRATDETQCTTLLVSQFRKLSSEKAMPRLSDFKDTSAGTQMASTVLTLWRYMGKDPDGKSLQYSTHIAVHKSRNDVPACTFVLEFDPRLRTYQDGGLYHDYIEYEIDFRSHEAAKAEKMINSTGLAPAVNTDAQNGLPF